MARLGTPALTVAEAAAALGVAPRTVRRWLQRGRLGGRKLGQTWVVWGLEDPPAARPLWPAGSHAMLRARVRQIGATLIAVGNAVAGASPRRGAVFLAWRSP